MADKFLVLFCAFIAIQMSFFSFSHSAESECVAGDTKDEDCNSCWCDGSEFYGYYWTCTRIGCPTRIDEYEIKRESDPDVDEVESLEEKETDEGDANCPRGKSYYDGCNWCHCSGKYGYTCTLRGCPGVGANFYPLPARFNYLLESTENA